VRHATLYLGLSRKNIKGTEASNLVTCVSVFKLSGARLGLWIRWHSGSFADITYAAVLSQFFFPVRHDIQVLIAEDLDDEPGCRFHFKNMPQPSQNSGATHVYPCVLWYPCNVYLIEHLMYISISHLHHSVFLYPHGVRHHIWRFCTVLLLNRRMDDCLPTHIRTRYDCCIVLPHSLTPSLFSNDKVSEFSEIGRLLFSTLIRIVSLEHAFGWY